MIRIAEDIDELLWNQFVIDHPMGNIYQTPAMYLLYLATAGYKPGVIIIEDAQNIKGVMVYNIIHEKGLKNIFTTRSIITGGPIVENNDPDLVQYILTEYKRKTDQLNIIYTQFRNQWNTSGWINQFKKYDYHYTDHLNIIIDLTKNEEQLIAEMQKKRYKNIKRAKNKNILIDSTTDKKDITAIIQLIKHTYKRINLPCPPETLFLNAREKLNEQVIFFAGRYNDEIIAARVYLLYKGTVYDWYAASNLNFSHLHANDLLPWEFMLWAKKNNFKNYDFVGAGNPNQPYGVRNYKMRFGGKLENFGRYQCIHKPVLYRIGKIGIHLIKKLKLSV